MIDHNIEESGVRYVGKQQRAKEAATVFDTEVDKGCLQRSQSGIRTA